MVTFKLMPVGVEVDLDAMEAQIKDSIKADRINREPIAFGLVALKAIKIIPEQDGLMAELEGKLRAIEGVSEVEVVEVTKTL
jgi:translation elongation factor aEF-1 beta